jgi:16S rRNA (guanine527-N7)-methyltransferase
VTAPGFRDSLASRLVEARLSLASNQIELLAEYWRLLERWNSRINLTSIPLEDFPSRGIDRLIVEPLMAALLIPPPPVAWFDLGSGGGSPAVPLKVVNPAANLTMVESRSRKGAFLREVVRSLGLTATEVAIARIEDVALRQAAAADCVTVRAVRSDKTLSDSALRLLRPAGRMILFEAADQERDLDGFRLIERVPVQATNSAIRVVVPRGTKD